MAVASPPTFAGFRPEAVEFLAELAANNERAWFQPRKADYERLLKEPLEGLCVALGERFQARGMPLRADPAKSPFRIYRDVRFAKDKSPYKTNIGASFPWVGAEDGDLTGRSRTENVHSSGGYFHLSPGEIYVGGGYWHPEKTWIDTFRQRVVADPAAFRALVDAPAFRTAFGELSRDGHVLQRVPAGYSADDPEAETLKLKDVVFGRRLSDAEAESASLPDVIADTFAVGIPLLRYLASIQLRQG
jgi:uncharacterized protein (TIGR02453 family)